MLWTLIRKEMLANVTSLRFVLTLLLVTSIFILSGFVFEGRYKLEVKDHRYSVNYNLSGLEEASKSLNNVSAYPQTIRKRPKTTQLFCEGFEKSLPNTFRVNGFTISIPSVVSRSNFLFPRFLDLDWAFIISLILSLIAFLITFDSFSAERERGTLRITMSNPVPRDKIILSKYLSGMLTLMIPLLVGILLNLIIVRLSGVNFVSIGQWIKLLTFVGLSMLYLSIFILLGILVSSRSARSSSSIVLLLFVWVIIVMVIPGAGGIIAERFVKVPTRSEVERRIQEAQNEVWENLDRYGKDVGSWGGDMKRNNPPARARMENDRTAAKNRIREQYMNSALAQISLGRNVTRLSPTVMYQCASEAILETGVARISNLYGQLKEYRGTLRDFVISVDRKDPDSLHLWVEPQYIRWHVLSREPVDFAAIPRFEEVNMPIASTLEGAMWDVGALVLLNLLLFMGAYISFLRSDVR